jgi:iron-sulfur cluster assembly protein
VDQTHVNADAAAPGGQAEAFVRKDMKVGEVVAKFPNSTDIMLQHGLHCVGCHISPYETIEQGSRAHGMSEGEIDEMVVEINAFIKDEEKTLLAENDGTLPAISLTEKAARQLKKLMSAEGKDGFGLRVGVADGGCAGQSYEMDFEHAPKGDDASQVSHGIAVFYSKGLEDALRGTVIDFRESLNASGFTMRNPNAKRSCACGSSFGV